MCFDELDHFRDDTCRIRTQIWDTFYYSSAQTYDTAEFVENDNLLLRIKINLLEQKLLFTTDDVFSDKKSDEFSDN